MKEVNVKRLHIVWCQPYDILEKENYGNSKKFQGLMERKSVMNI